MKKKMKSYEDAKGWVCHVEKREDGSLIKEGDNYKLEGGDGVQRLSMLSLFNYALSKGAMDQAAIKANFWIKSRSMWIRSEAFEVIEPTRHWDRSKWYGQSGTMSGDQIEAYMWACVGMELKEDFWFMWKMLFKRGFFAWNTKKIGATEGLKTSDFILLRMIGPTLRMLFLGGPGFLMAPFIILWDIVWLGLNSILRIIWPLFQREDTSDDLNFVVWLVASKLVFHNPANFFWSMLYVGFRPLARLKEVVGFDESQDGLLGAQTAFNQYFYEEAAPPIDEIASRVILWL